MTNARMLFANLLLANTFIHAQADDLNSQTVPTGITLDSMGNTISLAYENGLPAYYFSPIFTPVCNTGQCLPVYINLYWRLDGTYLKFDQPTGEILTKLDHVPFTPEDYLLLDEILRGPDPRFGIQPISHYSDPHPKRGAVDQSSPAPGFYLRKEVVSRYDMVDGVTGATAIQYEAKFVPGALYTTYTLWGLANDFRQTIFNYSTGNILATENLHYLMTHPEHGLQYYAFEKKLATTNEPNGRAGLLMGMMDTADAAFSYALFNYIRAEEFALDTVSNTLQRKFFQTSDLELKRRILYSWIYNFCPEQLVPELIPELSSNSDLIYEFSLLLSMKRHWLSAVLPDLLKQLPELVPEHQQYLIQYLELQKEELSKADRKLVKQARKKYGN